MARPRLRIDYETASQADLKKQGLDRYARHKSTKVLMAAYQFDDEEELLWEPHKGPMPARLRRALSDPGVRKIAFNAAFEIAITKHVLKINTEAKQGWCTMVLALTLGLAGKLEILLRDCLKAPAKYHKDARGEALIRKFCYPAGAKRYPEPWKTHPEEWEEFCEYCLQDVVAERYAFEKLFDYMPYPKTIYRKWWLDQEINLRGLPIDYDFIDACIEMREMCKAEYTEIMRAKTGLKNPNSVKQLLPWVRERGYPFSSMKKNRVEIALRDFGDDMTPRCRKVLRLRLESNKTSLTKFDAMLRASYEERLRNTYQFSGAAATGRYAGRILGQNLPRPTKAVEEHLAELREMILARDLDGIKERFGKPLEALASSIRSAIAPKKGKKLIVADYSSIELCVIAWLTDCKFWLDVVRSGKDAYKAFAEKWLRIPYDEVTKEQRTLAKPPALGCGYRLGAGRETGKYPDVEKIGLLGYADNMHVKMTKKQCQTAVDVYREISPEIVEAWTVLEEAAMKCVRTGQPQRAGKLRFDINGMFLRMRLPSGRYIHYCRPKLQKVRLIYEDRKTKKIVKKWKNGLTYERVAQGSGKWVRVSNHGGRFIEQGTQGIALDILQEGIEDATYDGFDVIGHYHDEVLAEVDKKSGLTLKDLLASLSRPKRWGKGLPLSAAGYEDFFYHK
jgi:DNA polymerase